MIPDELTDLDPVLAVGQGQVPARLVPIVLDWMTVLVVPTSRRMPFCVLPETQLLVIVVFVTAFEFDSVQCVGDRRGPAGSWCRSGCSRSCWTSRCRSTC